MISNLAQLAAPLSQDALLALLHGDRLQVLRGAMTPAHAALLDWESIRALLARGTYPRTDFRATREAKVAEAVFFAKGAAVDVGKVEALLAKGASVILSKIERQAPALGALAADLQDRTHESIHMHVVITTGQGGALPAHYDYEDLLILQLEGSKRWRIQAPTEIDPIAGMDQPAAPDTAPVFDDVLHQGDMMILPRGFWHHCDNDSARSIHLAIAFQPMAAWHAMRPLLRSLLRDEEFRRPLSRLESEEAFAAEEARLKNRLIEHIRAMPLRELMDEDRR